MTNVRTLLSLVLLFFSTILFAQSAIAERIPVSVQVTTSNQNWVETISICNTSTNAVPLTDIEFNFTYAKQMPTNIWGNPWLAWRLASQQGNQVTLLGGTPWSASLPPDPQCKNPVTIKFNASPDAPQPTGPFSFKSAGAVPSGIGNMQITMPSAPAAGVSVAQVKVEGMGTSFQQTVNWDTQWQLKDLLAGTYTITASPVDNGTDFFKANPIAATVSAQATTPVAIKYIPASQRPSSWNNIKHIVIIILENTNASSSLNLPYLSSLLSKGGYLTQYFAITHPSQPNYFALTGGSTFGADNSSVNLDALQIGDLLDSKGKTWKAYAEDYPGNCFLGSTSGYYARRHNPFISYRSVQNNPSQCIKIVNATQFFQDLAANNLPAYSFYIPNNKNNGHDTGAAYADNWLKNTFSTIFNDPNILRDTLFIITYDEDGGGENNKVYTLLLGAGIQAGTSSVSHYTHYSLLKTIESIYQLGNLGMNDQSAQEFSDIWSA